MTVESVLGAQVGNPPILPLEGTDVEGGPVEPPEGALVSEIVPEPDEDPATGA